MDVLQGCQLPRFFEAFADLLYVLAAVEGFLRVSRHGEIHGLLLFIIDPFFTL